MIVYDKKDNMIFFGSGFPYLNRETGQIHFQVKVALMTDNDPETLETLTPKKPEFVNTPEEVTDTIAMYIKNYIENESD